MGKLVNRVISALSFSSFGPELNSFLGVFQVFRNGMNVSRAPGFTLDERKLISERGLCLRKGVSYFQVRKAYLKEEALWR